MKKVYDNGELAKQKREAFLRIAKSRIERRGEIDAADTLDGRAATFFDTLYQARSWRDYQRFAGMSGTRFREADADGDLGEPVGMISIIKRIAVATRVRMRMESTDIEKTQREAGARVAKLIDEKISAYGRDVSYLGEALLKVQKAYDGEKTAFEAMKLVAPLANALREPPPLLRRARYWEKARAAALALEERHQELARIVDDLPELKAGLPSGVALTHFKVSDPDRTEAQADWWRYLAQIVDFTHRFDITY
jgi:hypothetical protein